ncbi:MAG: hypothetical protein HGA44_08205 [Cellulomonadaceae bacterium]|nr:hypothetical protein [Cellulomonadaceae bacterium]
MIGHQTVSTLSGVAVRTLADLWPSPCRAVIVGVNPAPRSVEVGHYYQGSNGRTAMTRLRAAGLLPPEAGGFVDDEAVAASVGFTDVVKRPTRRSSELSTAELTEGCARLRAELELRRVPLIVCVFKPAVVALLGRADPPGFQAGTFGVSRVFRMPGPYAPSLEATAVMSELDAHLAGL